MNILLIVEGSVDEKNIFDGVFSKYGFNTIISKEKMDVDILGQFEKIQYQLGNNSVVIIQGPRSRIHDFLKYYNENEMSIERLFSYSYAFFSGIFLIYDVDHNDCDDIEKMFKKFSDESTGMLLLSSPCIEVVADYDKNREPTRYTHIKEYKADINKHYDGHTHDFIINHFEELIIYYLDKNYSDFKETNIMEHPGLIIESINTKNERVNFKDRESSFVLYRYFSTVIYVAIAFANGLTKQIDNYQIVRDFFLKGK